MSLTTAYRPPPGSIPTLPVPDPSGWRRLHLIGVGGAGMRQIARMLLARGVAVTGSDLKDSAGVASLREAGATVFVGHRAEQVGRPDAVVVSSAVPERNPELRAAREAGIEVLTRAQVLVALMRGARGVAIAGTHGKTSTTSLVSVILTRAGLSPSYIVGGDLNESGTGGAHGDGDLFVVEADESDGTFLLMHPEIAVVTNIEGDHLNFYGTPEQLDAAFAEFAGRATTVIACWDDPGVRRVFEGDGRFTGRLVRYGSDPNLDLDLRLVSPRQEGRVTIGKVEVDGCVAEVRVGLPGLHYLLNAVAALGVGLALGVPLEEAAQSVASFEGVRRRFERRGVAAGAEFVDDYAHHPTEVGATIRAAQEAEPGRRVVAVCQPHRYSRISVLWRELGEALVDADVAIVTDVYGASEEPVPGVTGKLVLNALTEAAPRKPAVYLKRRSDVAPFLADFVRDGDLVVTLGCGDIGGACGETLDLLRARGEEVTP